jgi:hypothetical protein
VRSALRRVRSGLRRPGGTLLAVLLVLAAGLAAATAVEPAPVGDAAGAGPGPVREVDVARASAACPDPVVDEVTGTRVTLAAPGAGPGQASVSPTGAAGTPLLRLEAPGSATAAPGSGTGPLVVRGSGGSAPGLAAAQLTRSTNATMRGLAGTACAATGTDFWFVGSGAVVGQRGRVYLTNTEAAPAVVDVEIFGPDGPVEAPDARGITVAAGEQEVRLLDALSPETERFALHVHARQGSISAAVRDLQVEGLTPLGADWVPPSAPPALRVLVPGVPGGEGERRLQVVAPGESDAIVQVRLLSDSGAFAPAGLDVIEVAAGSVGDVDLAPFTGGEAVTVELESDAPVTAGVLTRLAPPEGQLGDIAYAGSGWPLRPETPGVLAQAVTGENVASTLYLTAPGAAATVVLEPLPPAVGEPLEVAVPAQSMVPVDLATVSTAEVFALRVTPRPRSGPVLAVRQTDEVEARGPMVTSSPVLPGRYTVPVPRVVADLSTGLGAGGG